MKFPQLSTLVAATSVLALVADRDTSGFSTGQPIDGTGKGAPIVGGTNHELDLQNPDNLGQQSTDSGVVPNLKWSFSDSKTKLLKGGWVRESVITDLPASVDIAAAQQHLTRGSIRELHWHSVAEWGYVFAGSILVSAVDEDGKFQLSKLEVGDVWYFPKGEAHTIQGLDEQNEFLLVFDDGNFDPTGVTFALDDWVAHTPKAILAKNFGLDESVFASVPSPNPYIVNSTVQSYNVTGPNGELTGNSSYVYYAKDHPLEKVPGGGGTLRIIDTTTFPIATTLSATVVHLKPGALRELHWHPTDSSEWLYFHQGNARATVFIGSSNARTFDFRAGDTGVFPDNSGHYIENIGTEELIWIEIYKSDRVKDISLTQWLALTPAHLVADVLHIPISVAQNLKKDKQVLIK